MILSTFESRARYGSLRSASVLKVCVVLIMGCIVWANSGASTGLRAQEARPAVEVREPAANPTTSSASSVDNGSTSPAAAGASGGGVQADFDSLIELIEATVAPEDWETAGGSNTIMEFPGGVFVDGQGVLRTLSRATTQKLAPHWSKRDRFWDATLQEKKVMEYHPQRHVSVVGVMRQWKEAIERGTPVSPSVLRLGGLSRIDYVWFDRASRDCVLIGPAGAWTVDKQGREVSRHDQRPVLHLHDLATLLQTMLAGEQHMICAITPTQDGLARAQEFAQRTTARPIPAGRRSAWLHELSEALGNQRIEVGGIPAGTRAARVIIEADHHMKQIGIGLVPGTQNVPSYLDRLVADRVTTQSLDVLRWWFTIDPDATAACRDGVFSFESQVVRVLSENELLTERGERVHTGKSDPRNEQFVRDFTKHYPELAQRYPVYADLDNLFRLAIVGVLMRRDTTAAPADQTWTSWWREQGLKAPTDRSPQWVPSIVNARSIDRRHFVAAVSGGVRCVATEIKINQDSAARELPTNTTEAMTTETAGDEPWWWDP